MNSLSTEAITLIIGGAIAILSAILTSTVSYIFQSCDAKKQRKWHLDDIAREKEEKFYLQRIDETEKCIKDIINMVSALPTKIERYLDDELSFTEFMQDVSPILKSVELSPSLESLADEELLRHFDAFGDKVSSLLINIQVITQRYKKQEIDRAQAGVEIFGLLNSFEEPYHHIIVRLDQLRIIKVKAK